VSELRDRLERLASRGTRRGADAVLRDAEGTARADGAADAHSTEGDLEVIDILPLVTPEPARRSGRFGALIAATGVAALVAVGALAVAAMFGSGGADSPEGAVRQLADAVEHKDALAAVDVLEPTEVRSMRETVKGITHRAADLKIVDDASQPLAGVDLSVDHLQLSSTDLADGYAKVTITSGTLSATAHREALSHLLQDATRTWEPGQRSNEVDLARLASGNDLPTFVMTVRHDGHWYVSPMYTALEYAREAAGGPPADFGSAHAAQLGADSPELAVSDAFHAWQAGDWNRLIALAPPDELPVYDYRAWLDQEGADSHPDFTIDSLTTTADVSGDHGIVKLSGSGTMGSGSDRQTWQVGGTCPSLGDWWANSWTFSDGTESASSATGPGLCLAGDLAPSVPYGLFLAQPEPDTAASGPVSIEVVREDGRWFVSPVSTALDLVDSFVAHVDERTLYPLINLGYLLPPDGALTINQPLHFADAVTGAQVYEFEGQAGQQVIGEVERPNSRYAYLSGEIYTADGRDAGYIDFQSTGEGCCSFPVDLPSTGSYRLVIESYVPSNTTLTLWDKDHAPKGLQQSGNGGGAFDFVGGSEQCTYSGNAASCTSVKVPVPSRVGIGSKHAVATTTVP
jgi:hypothetical protein